MTREELRSSGYVIICYKPIIEQGAQTTNISEAVQNWICELERLSDIAKDFPHEAYTAFAFDSQIDSQIHPYNSNCLRHIKRSETSTTRDQT